MASRRSGTSRELGPKELGPLVGDAGKLSNKQAQHLKIESRHVRKATALTHFNRNTSATPLPLLCYASTQSVANSVALPVPESWKCLGSGLGEPTLRAWGACADFLIEGWAGSCQKPLQAHACTY